MTQAGEFTIDDLFELVFPEYLGVSGEICMIFQTFLDAADTKLIGCCSLRAFAPSAMWGEPSRWIGKPLLSYTEAMKKPPDNLHSPASRMPLIFFSQACARCRLMWVALSKN
jgi:hypothetical protein